MDKQRKKPGPQKTGRDHGATIRLNMYPEESSIIDDWFRDGMTIKGRQITVWCLQGISKAHEVSPFMQARAMIEATKDKDLLNQLLIIINKEIAHR